MGAIEIQGLTKEFGDVTAIKDLNLEVNDGEVYGFLGPNGAGKSTTINILLDFIRPTEGSATVLGLDAQDKSVEVRDRTGVLPEAFGLYDRLTGRKHIEFAIRSKGADDNPEAILERVGLEDSGSRKAGGYSKGMKQRLGLGIALVGDPDLLILDEPSTGLDPNGAREMRQIVREEKERGATVFFSSHILEQVEKSCDRVGILRDGKLVAQDSIEGLRDELGTESVLSISVDAIPDGTLQRIKGLQGVTDVTAEDNTITVKCGESTAKNEILRAVEELGAEITDFSTQEASLEELFASYTTGGEG
ncbi:MAG: ABC transporter ATP-binding protein [Halobacteria archaeon]|nr:ABC transporter ATP-binding protein [Halobacteria archaeon]